MWNKKNEPVIYNCSGAKIVIVPGFLIADHKMLSILQQHPGGIRTIHVFVFSMHASIIWTSSCRSLVQVRVLIVTHYLYHYLNLSQSWRTKKTRCLPFERKKVSSYFFLMRLSCLQIVMLDIVRVCGNGSASPVAHSLSSRRKLFEINYPWCTARPMVFFFFFL
jgi:hypothetical protein